VAMELDPGDAVMMDPGVLHTGGVNTTGSIRYGVYFRWLEDAVTDAGAAVGSRG
jgi:ectoine hydroxylase-related dioxygenase (phytanoyl-CoA dioxygenase family)